MITLLERAAAADPEAVAVVTEQGSTTYGELLVRAREVAAALSERTVDRFAVVETDVARLVPLLAGAALAGAEPCQYQPDTEPAELVAELARLGHDVVVSRRTDIGAVVDPDSLVGTAAPDRSAAQPVLIRTTGSTGAPKAARHDWTRLARTVERVRPRPDQRWLLAYGPHQMAGVQVLMHVLAARATLVAPFPRQPRDGLRAMVDHGVTCASATPTYWRFLLAQARSRDVDLPRLEQVTLGGEAVPPDLLSEVRAAFPGARVSQVYASTELGSVASVTDGRPGLDAARLHGPDNPGGSLRIVDGELWVRSETGMLGYAGEDDSSAPEDGWRPTGDLVELVGDRIQFRGRTSEVINVGGVKVHPLPVENRLTAIDGVAAARVFGRANRLTGAIVAAEIVPGPDADQAALREQVRNAVGDLPRAWHPRSITFVEALEIRGGKTIRRIEK
ncbi:class I adenylate-forming enzyme family protein [Nocardioides sp. SYSU DS0651]|uniref:class I adenylate-forming enzyme family protein n=1 Tax=Nocardioides sp. SYSU DS0651 TaxID=3415955 RepID=UPI003F4BFD42